MLQAMGFDGPQARVALEACQGNCAQAVDWLLLASGDDDNTNNTTTNNNNNNDYAPAPVMTASPSSAEVHGSATSRNRLFLETTATTTTPTTTTTTAVEQHSLFQRMIPGRSSQYSVAQGRSACTCMALIGARNFLRSMDSNRRAATTTTSTTTTTFTHRIITPTFLHDMIQQGVQLYQNVLASSTVGGTLSAEHLSAEHLSAEDVLRSGCLTELEWVGESIRQGVLTTPTHHQNHQHSPGLYNLLAEIIQESKRARGSSVSTLEPTSYICVVMTKSPETILLCLPTDHYLPTRIESASSSSSSSPSFDKNDHNTTAVTTVPQQQQQQNSPLPFYLIDTHPRPHWLFGSSTTTTTPQHQHQHSYALECASLSDLVACCHQLFPVVQLGSDVSELVAMMYNSFDLYTVQ